MKVEKKKISELTKCYSITPLRYKGAQHFLVASEKVDKCLLFDLEGNRKAVVWDGFGGVMTMVQVPGTDGQFLAVHKFYSPNNAREAKIVIVTPNNGAWEARTLVDLPYVHRFDILERNGIRYLIACSLKSNQGYDDDWRFPGKVYAAVLPDDLSGFDEAHQLELTVIKDNMLKNHGYYRTEDNGVSTGIISCDSGVFQFIPPVSANAPWEIITQTTDAASDAVLVDFDGDGEKEMAVIAPFHGNKLRFYKKQNGVFTMVYEYPENLDFLHAIFGGAICGRNMLVIGHRGGLRDLMCFYYENGSYKMEYLDRDCGAANVYHFTNHGADYLVSANREIDEVALYRITLSPYSGKNKSGPRGG